MNADHADSITAMLKHNIGIDVDSSSILGLDRCKPSLGLCKGGCSLDPPFLLAQPHQIFSTFVLSAGLA